MSFLDVMGLSCELDYRKLSFNSYAFANKFSTGNQLKVQAATSISKVRFDTFSRLIYFLLQTYMHIMHFFP